MTVSTLVAIFHDFCLQRAPNAAVEIRISLP